MVYTSPLGFILILILILQENLNLCQSIYFSNFLIQSDQYIDDHFYQFPSSLDTPVSSRKEKVTLPYLHIEYFSIFNVIKTFEAAGKKLVL